ncbi:hypothetical protein N7517_001988 [Penicillium concentricum]|uniref:Rhodopsin domain-containing protein n=1 Tax=Penicillium concentricum TaxID=293559 RepID=A0A9W9SSZ2_9EURO|nr:uncharacterized protein N7517_001988 [Penicillium concentricum]KAJ5384077.1 hypothetical protein N7517_001988 [Penicillium concentricum]
MATMDAEYMNQTKGPRILGVFWAFFSVSVVMVSLRLYIRARMLRNTGLDDYIIVAAMVMVTSYTVLTTVNVLLGYGSHTSVLMERGGMDLVERILVINYANFALGIMSFTTPKLAIAALLNRIMNPSRFHRIWLWILTASVFVASTICIIVLFTMCDPPQALWKIHLMAEGATCRSTTILVGYAIFTGVLSAVVDLYLAIYPTVVLLRLQMSLEKKLALCAALGLGAVACAMAIVKCLQLPGLYNTADSTYATADLVIWTSVESNIIIMASCIPTLGPIYEMIRGKRSWSSHGRYDSGKMRSYTDRPTKKSNNTCEDDDILMTTNIETTRSGSQESILNSDQLQKEAHVVGKIHRTDQVKIEYGARPQGDHEPRPSW